MKPSVMYNFCRNMWIEDRCDEAYIMIQVERNRLRLDEAKEIMALERTGKR